MNRNYCPYCMTPVPEGETCTVCKLTEGTYVPSPHHLPPGTILMDRYLVGRVLGEGGFGITYIGRDLRLELKVAIKEYYPVDRATRNASASLTVTNFIGPSQKSFERGRQKFLDEAQVMARMDKQQVIVSVRDFFETNNTAYIVMEYIEGITFRELVEKKGGRIAPDELFLLIEPLLRALSIMHENGLIHRDISPDNLMLEDGRVRLLDFGCAREASRGTETMTIALKHGYAPIEQYQQKGQGPWTDIYALCATIYYCLTGRVPPQALDRITGDELLLPGKLGVDLTVEQERALLKGMRLQPNRRFATARELWAALYAPQPAPGTDREAQPAPDTDRGTPSAPDTDREAPSAPGADREAQPAPGADRELPSVPDTDRGTQPCEFAEGEKGAGGRQFTGKRLLAVAGAFAACIILAAAVWIGMYTRQTAGTKQTAGLGETGVQTVPIPAGPAVFDDAYVMKDGDGEELARLMEDDSVKAVAVESGYLDIRRIAITKPVRLAEGTCLNTDYLVIEQDGYLQLEGQLRMDGMPYLRLAGDEVRLFAAESAELRLSSMGMVWMDSAECFAGEGELPGRKLVFSTDVFEQEDVVSVHDFPSLAKAAGSKKPVSIDSDLTLTQSLSFDAPVKISDGVTVRTDLGNMDCSFCLEEGGVLYNDGVFEGDLFANADAAVINHSSIRSPGLDGAASFWMEGESFLVNFGDLDADNCSRFWDDTALYNLGEFYSYDFYLVGGDMANFGKVTLLDRDSCFEIANASRLINMPGAAVTVAANAEFVNDGWIVNLGEITIRENGVFDNMVLENYGQFRVETAAKIDRGRTGIYCGIGEYDFGSMDVNVFATDYGYGIEPDLLARAANEEELVRALKRADTPGVLITADVAVETDLSVDKTVYVDAGCSLTMAAGAKLTDHGGAIVLRENASLRGSNFLLSDGAQIYLNDRADFTVNEGGSLVLDNALLWSEGEEVRMNGAKLVLRNAASAVFSWLSRLNLDDSEITLQKDSAFAVPFDGGLSADNAVITLEGAGGRTSFYIPQDTTLTDCTLNIESGCVRSCAKNLNLRNCTVRIGADGLLISECSSLSLLAGTAVENRGIMNVYGWDEYAFTVQGPITNYGSMDLGLKNIRIAEAIDNQGELYYWSGFYKEKPIDWDACVKGNAPIDQDRQ